VAVEEEVVVEDAAWAVAVVAVVEEDVAAEASDQPTNMSRTENNHCLDATSTRKLSWNNQTTQKSTIPPIVSSNLRKQDINPDHTYGQDSLCHRADSANVAKKERSTKSFNDQCIFKGGYFLTL